MDIFGLSALDRLFCFMIVQELQNFTRYLQRNLMKTAAFVKMLQMYVGEAGDGSDLMRTCCVCVCVRVKERVH